jgi:hypothetical protein
VPIDVSRRRDSPWSSLGEDRPVPALMLDRLLADDEADAIALTS